MKKVLSVTLAGLMGLSLVACGPSASEVAASKEADATAAATEAAGAAEAGG